MGTFTGAAAQDSERLAADWAWVRWGMAAAVTGMLAWVIAFALIPLDARLDQGEQHLVQVARAHTGQLYAAGLLAVLGAVLLAAFFVVLARLVPEGSLGGGLLRVSLAGCVITQTMVATGAASGLAGLHAAAGNADAGLAALGWRGLWLTLWASGVPTIVFTVTGVLGLRQAGLSPPWVSALGWLSAAAHVLALFTLAQRGPSRRTGSLAGSSRSPPSSGSSPWPPPCRDRSGQPSRPPPEPAGDQGHGRSRSHVTHHSPPSQDFADPWPQPG